MRRSISLYSVILLAAGIFFFIPRVSFSDMMKSEKPAAKKPGAKEPKLEKIEARIKELDDKLDLGLEQKAKIREILTDVKQEVSKLVNDAASKAKKLREEGDAKIEALLTKEQRDIFNNVPKEQEQEEDEMLKVFK